MLKVDGLSVNYGYVQALQDLSFEVSEGEIVCLIGSNGSGKTTTLMSISGICKKRAGVITFDGSDITNTAAHVIVKQGISHVPEGRHIFPKLSVEDNLIMGTISNQRLSKSEVKRRIEEQYNLFPRLRERRKQMGGTLSGGEQQMLAIGRGLMNDPKLIMLDEPSLGLAPIIIEEIFELIVNIKKKGKTVLLIEQNAAMALLISDRGYVLENGEMTISGEGKSLLDNDDVKRAYLGA